jgi:hypothetical protein
MIAKFRLLSLSLLALCLIAGAKKEPELTVRFHREANRLDGEQFANPVQLRFPPRQAYIEKIPSISERHIYAIYPMQAPDGTWGCTFQLNPSGRMNLEVLSTEFRGKSLVVFISTKRGVHQVIDMQIDKPISDGIISVPNGLSQMEIAALEKAFPIMGQVGKKKR